MTDYSKLKVAELKDLIKERGIASTGLKVKQNFVDALEADDANDEGDEGNERNEGKGKNAPAEPEQSDADVEAAAAAEADVTIVEALDVEEQTGETEGNDPATSAEDIQPISEGLESGHKRKRRSPTPPLSEEVVNKKLKTVEQKAEEIIEVKLPEDAALADESHDQVAASAESLTPEPFPIDDAATEDPPTFGPPSKHPPTHALYIRELVRPLQPNALREHLSAISQPDEASASAAIEAFHLDKLRSHALVVFDSIPAATRARAALHDKVWPEEPMRKPLWVDFVPDDKVQEWIDIEVERGDMTRWEVVYASSGLDTDGPVAVSLQEVDAGANNARKPSGQGTAPRPPAGTGEGMPNAPSGPRQRSAQLPPATPATPIATEPPKPSQTRFDSLDQMYSFTEAKPKIYYQPVATELVQRRQEELDRGTSRDWDDAYADPAAYGEGELRRYTFEDGDRLVDGGADFGLFGRRGRGGGPPRGGRGRGGDHYRGGGNRWR